MVVEGEYSQGNGNTYMYAVIGWPNNLIYNCSMFCSIGIKEPILDKCAHNGIMTTEEDDCIFVCVTQKLFNTIAQLVCILDR